MSKMKKQCKTKTGNASVASAIAKIRKIAATREANEKIKFEKLAAESRRVIDEIRSHRDDLLGISEVVYELSKHGLLTGKRASGLVCRRDLRNVGLSCKSRKCFGGYGIVPRIPKLLSENEDSLFYDIGKDCFILCEEGRENVHAADRDEWIVNSCVKHKSLMKAFRSIADAARSYKAEVMKIVEKLDEP